MIMRRAIGARVGVFLFTPALKRRVWKRLYRRYNRRLGERRVSFLDYGYASTDDEPEASPRTGPANAAAGSRPAVASPGAGPAEASAETGPAVASAGIRPADAASAAVASCDPAHRTHIGLYHRVAAAVELRGRDVLEVGCGRGGGAAYVAEHLGPRSYAAVDLAEMAVAYARREHGRSVRFGCGDAQRLPFDDGAFDAIINIESSHCYPSFPAFLAEVVRVLRPGGHFLYADFRRAAHQQAWSDDLGASGLHLVDAEDITPNVVRAMEENDGRKRALLADIAPRYLQKTLAEFMGCQGSEIYRDFVAGRASYRRFVLRKAAPDAGQSVDATGWEDGVAG